MMFSPLYVVYENRGWERSCLTKNCCEHAQQIQDNFANLLQTAKVASQPSLLRRAICLHRHEMLLDHPDALRRRYAISFKLMA